MRFIVAAFAASLATGMTFAQSPDPARDASRGTPGQQQSRAGTVTNPPAPAGNGEGASTGEPRSAESRAPRPAAPHADGAVKEQAEAKRRAALEHCQTLTGASRTDCVQRADAEYRRATSDDTLSDERAPEPSLG